MGSRPSIYPTAFPALLRRAEAPRPAPAPPAPPSSPSCPRTRRGCLAGARGEAPAGAGRGGIASGPTIQFASVLVHVVNEGVLRPSPVDDFDRFCTPPCSFRMALARSLASSSLTARPA